MLNINDDIILAHSITKEFITSLSNKKQAGYFLPNLKIAQTKSLKKILKITTQITTSLCCVYILFILCFFGFVHDSSEGVNNALAWTLLAIFLIASTLVVAYFFEDLKIYQTRRPREKIESRQLMTKNLQKMDLLHQRIFTIVTKSFDIALEDGTKDNFVALVSSNILTELNLVEADLLLKEKCKRLIATIAHGNFIIESLDLLGIAKDTDLYESLQTIIQGFDELITNEKSNEKPDSFLLEEFQEIKQNFNQIDQIITHIKLYEEDKIFSDSLQRDAKKLQRITKTKPVAKTNISFKKKSQNLSNDELLSTITALDESIVEIRTRAGTYYTNLENIQKEDPRKQREIELLTDKELLVKQEVITSTLDLLEQEKQNIPEKEYEQIKNENLTALFTSKNVLEKRKGLAKQVICPYCQEKNSSIQEFCKSCNKALPYCIVCLNSLGVGEQIKTCPHCKSVAHSKHFDDWLSKSKNCPYCKREIKEGLVETTLK